MKMAATTRTWAIIKKHIPMIKFRSQLNSQGHSGTANATPNVTPAELAPSKMTLRTVIEDWQLPPRYQRKPISIEEMECINRGGSM